MKKAVSFVLFMLLALAFSITAVAADDDFTKYKVVFNAGEGIGEDQVAGYYSIGTSVRLPSSVGCGFNHSDKNYSFLCWNICGGAFEYGDTFIFSEEMAVKNDENQYTVYATAEWWTLRTETGYCGGEGDGTNLIWTFTEDGTLTISGKGKMANYSSNKQAPWYKYTSKHEVDKLVMEEGITSIGNYAFWGCLGSGNLVIPNGVTSIGSYAFFRCSGLTGDLVIPNNVISIGDYAFYQCGINDFYFKGNAPEIGLNCFSQNEDIIYYQAANKTWEIIDGKWNGYTAVAYNPVIASGYCGGEGDGTNLIWTLTEDGTLTISGEGKMAGYSSHNTYYGDVMAPWINSGEKISSLVIDEGITSIGHYAFYNCIEITGELKIPTSVTSIGWNAFTYCSGFTGNLVIPNSVTEIGGEAFAYCSGFTGDLALPRSLKSIDYGVFSGCSGFDGTLTIPRSVTTIRYHAFENCTGFTGNLIIPGNVYEIEDYAFSGCTGFDGKLSLPESLNYIYDYAFYNCSGLTGELVIPDDCVIYDYVFSGCLGFTGNLVVPNQWWIGEGAFENCSGFTGSLVLDVQEIGAKAFSGCTGLDGYLTIGKGIETIGDKAFENCNLKGKITFGENLTHVGGGAFSTCKNLKEFEFLGEAPVVVAAEYGNRSFAKDAVMYYSFGWDYWNSPTWEGYSAVETTEPDAALTISSVSIGLNTVRKVSVGLSENSNATNIQFALKYDPAMLKVVSCEAGSLVEGANINCNNNGVIYFAWENVDGLLDAGNLLEIVFTPAENAQFRETNVEVDKTEKFIFRDENLKSLKIEIVNGTVMIKDVVYGDVNGDGSIDVIDANMIRRSVVKYITLTEEQRLAADVNGDGKVNTIDANYIRRYAVKLLSKFPVE